ncbi:hypothetical protein R1flu_017603 [Riccia fluitans]|uniref:Reverse transcriptase zinc-binding domain-containing protein n=1 Tax=Riccia fluitans TaxID=41844 RepID=A0ABD1ZEQ7_9MARC
MLLRTPGDKRRSQAITEAGTKRINERRLSLVGNSADALVIKKKSKMDTEDLQATAEYNILGPDQWAIDNLQNWQGLDRLSTAHLPTNRNLFGQTSTLLQGYRQALMPNNSEYEQEPMVTGVALEAGLVHTSNSASPGQMRLAPTPSRSISSLNNPNSTSGSLSGKGSATPHSRNHAKQVVDPCDQDLNAGSPVEDCRVEIASPAQVMPGIPISLASSPVSTPSPSQKTAQEDSDNQKCANDEEYQPHLSDIGSEWSEPETNTQETAAEINKRRSSEDQDMIATTGGSKEEAPPRSTDGTAKEQNLTNEVEDAEVGTSMLIPLPDLNIVPSSREQTIERNRLDKLSKKEKKRKQKKEQRRRRLERTRHLTGAEIEDGVGVHAENASSSDEGSPSARKMQLEELRMHLAHNYNEQTAQDLRKLESQICEDEQLECSILRRRSRAVWTEKGEACTKYFFATLKTKQLAERMEILIDDEGRELRDEDAILEQVQSYYKALYTQPRITVADMQEQRRALSLIDPLITKNDNKKLSELPGADELWQIVKDLPSDKSPGEDGIPVEVLRALWDVVGEGCLAFVREAWTTKRIGSGKSSDWAHMIRFFVKEQMTRRAYCREVRQWTAEEGIQRLELSPSWRWKLETRWKGWKRPSTFWHKVEDSEETAEDLSTKWPLGSYILTWSARWRKLWDRGGVPRVKLWLWKLLRRAFFTSERAMTMQVSNDLCCRCKSAIETVSHLFFDCNTSRSRWNQLCELANRTGANFQVAGSLLELLDEAIQTKRRGSSLVFILYSVTCAIWKDRNHMFFHKKLQSTPLQRSLELARAEIEGSFNNRSSDLRWQHGLKTLKEVENLLETLNSVSTTSLNQAGDEREGGRRAEPSSSNRRNPLAEVSSTDSGSRINLAARILSISSTRPREEGRPNACEEQLSTRATSITYSRSSYEQLERTPSNNLMRPHEDDRRSEGEIEPSSGSMPRGNGRYSDLSSADMDGSRYATFGGATIELATQFSRIFLRGWASHHHV